MPSIRAYLAAEEDPTIEPLTVDEYLSALEDLPDPNECPYCWQSIQENNHAVTWQRVELARDVNGELEAVDYASMNWEITQLDHYSCSGYSHHFTDLGALDQEQREQHALRIAVGTMPSHLWDVYGTDPGTAARLQVIYGPRPDGMTFAGSRARMAFAERREANVYHYPSASRERHTRYFTPPPVEMTPAQETERDYAAAGIL